jgi:hypothetical protein
MVLGSGSTPEAKDGSTAPGGLREPGENGTDAPDNAGNRSQVGATSINTSGFTTEIDSAGRVTKVVKYAGSVILMRASMNDYRLTDGAAVPYSISIDDGTQRIGIRYTRVNVKPELSPETFRTRFSP